MVATAIIGSAVVGAGAQAFGASSAADAQTNAANQANALQRDQYNQTRADLALYNQLGIDATGIMRTKIGEGLLNPINMDQATLEKTPGYQFNLTQGLKGVQNSAAARGLGASGAAQKGAAAFATGLADSTYQNQFNNANTNQTNAYNRLMGLINSGQNAGAAVASSNQQNVNQQSGNLIGAGNAQAASYNAIGRAGAGAANNIGGYYTYQGLYGGAGSGGGEGPAWGESAAF